MNIAIVAGEHSGDNLGANLIKSLIAHYPQASFFGIGGVGMQEQGLESLAPMDKLSIMGLVEVLPKVPELYLLRKKLIGQFLEKGVDVFIGIDAPDFNLGLAKRLKDKGIKTVHYVSPSVWAWRRKRIIKIKQSVDLMITLFPFEQSFYSAHKQPSICVGHPLANTFNVGKTTDDVAKARASLGLSAGKNGTDKTIVALMPGSRMGEVTKLLGDFLEAAKRVDLYGDVQFVLSVANDKVESFILAQDLPKIDIRIIKGKSEAIMRASDVLLIASGTATFEGLLCKTPMVAAYKLNALTYHIARRLVKTPFYTLPNILANQLLVPEHIQYYTADILANDVIERLDNETLRESLIEQFDTIHRGLQIGGSDKAAQAIGQLLESTC